MTFTIFEAFQNVRVKLLICILIHKIMNYIQSGGIVFIMKKREMRENTFLIFIVTNGLRFNASLQGNKILESNSYGEEFLFRFTRKVYVMLEMFLTKIGLKIPKIVNIIAFS